jgi:hypothetical protein
MEPSPQGRSNSPDVAGDVTRLFDDVPKANWLDLVSSTEFSNGNVGLHYRRTGANRGVGPSNDLGE